MQLFLDANGLEIDAWLTDFTSATVVFAVWHHEKRVEGVAIRLDRETDHDGKAYVRCALRADTAGGPVSSGATGHDVCEVILEAANLLELAMVKPAAEAIQRTTGRLAA